MSAKRLQRKIAYWMRISLMLAALLVFAPGALAGHAVDGTDVKVVNDNPTLIPQPPTPSFDGQNRQQNEITTAINPANHQIVAMGANDYRMVPTFGDTWIGFYVSQDGGSTWFNTFVPGFPTDTSAAGQASPLLGLDGSGDPVVRFDGEGNLYVNGIAFNRNFDQEDTYNDAVVYVAKYSYTPGSPQGVSTPNAAGNPANYTYEFTSIVARGAVAFAIPPQTPYGFAGQFDDKNWMAVDDNPDSPCYGNIYVSHTRFSGLGGSFPIVFARSTDGGQSFSEPRAVSQKGKEGTQYTQGSNISTGPDGTVYVAYRTFASNSDPENRIQVVTSRDCGKSFGKPVTAAVFTPMPRQAAGLSFRTPSFAWVAADDLEAGQVYVAYSSMTGTPSHADVFVALSSDVGASWGPPVKVNDDSTNKHQFWPTISVSRGALHVAWYDFRDSPNSSNPVEDMTVSQVQIYYATSNTGGVDYPSFQHNLAVTDQPFNPNCLTFGGGTDNFFGDYIEVDAVWDGLLGQHIVHVGWTDTRDIVDCDTDYAPGPNVNMTNRNQNVYGDKLLVDP